MASMEPMLSSLDLFQRRCQRNLGVWRDSLTRPDDLAVLQVESLNDEVVVCRQRRSDVPNTTQSRKSRSRDSG